MNLLIQIDWENGIGDNIGITPFICDLKSQYPNINIFIKTDKFDLFLYNNYVFKYTNQKIDLKYFYTYRDFTMNRLNKIKYVNQDNFLNRVYKVFFEKTKILVNQKTFQNKIYGLQKQNLNINIDKPICLLSTSKKSSGQKQVKYCGTLKYQNIVNALKKDINFIQIGQNSIHDNVILDGVLNLTNKTSIRQLLKLCSLSDYVITGISGLYHFSFIDTPNNKIVFCLGGCRQTPFYTNCYNVKNVQCNWLGYNLNKYKDICLNDSLCCYSRGIDFDRTNKQQLCKSFIFDNQYKQCIANCLNDIDENIIINRIKKDLLTK